MDRGVRVKLEGDESVFDGMLYEGTWLLGMQASIFCASSQPRNREGCGKKSIRHKILGIVG